MSRFSQLLHSSASLGMTGNERRNASSTLERRILVSVGDTHGQRRISKEGSRNALGTAAGRASDDAGYLVITRRKNSFPDDESLSLHHRPPNGGAVSEGG